MKKLIPLTNNERAAHSGFTHSVRLDLGDLTETGAGTAQTIDVGGILPGDFVQKAMLVLTKGFKDKSDTAFDSVTVAVGDTSSNTQFFAAQQVAALSGSVIATPKLNNTAVGPYTAADKVRFTVTPKTGKKLADLDEGELHVFVQFPNPAPLAQARGEVPILVPVS